MVGRATSLLPICNESNFINVIAIIIVININITINIIVIIIIIININITINIIVNIININATAAPPVSNKSNIFFQLQSTDRPEVICANLLRQLQNNCNYQSSDWL